jgi:hypothetical protein
MQRSHVSRPGFLVTGVLRDNQGTILRTSYLHGTFHVLYPLPAGHMVHREQMCEQLVRLL